MFDMLKIKADQIDTSVNEFLKTHSIKERDDIIIETDERFMRVTIVYKVKVDQV